MVDKSNVLALIDEINADPFSSSVHASLSQTLGSLLTVLKEDSSDVSEIKNAVECSSCLLVPTLHYLYVLIVKLNAQKLYLIR